LAQSDRFASGGGHSIEDDFAVVQFLLPGLWGRVGVEACQVGEQGLSMILAADDCGVSVPPVEHGV